jgi:hypothetical protein
MTPLERHTIDEAFNPSADTEQWLAFIILNHLNPNLTYLSWDGYHCHGLADHSVGIMWQDNWMKDTKTNLRLPAPDFTMQNKTTIVNLWTQLIQEITK